MKPFQVPLLAIVISALLAIALKETALANIFPSAVRFTQAGSDAPFDGDFTDGTGMEIRFVVNEHADSVQINIWTAVNPLVRKRTLKAYSLDAGDTSIVWDGKDNSDVFVGPGQYRIQIAAYGKVYSSYTEIFYDQPAIFTRGVTAITNPALKNFGFIYSASNGGYVTGIARHSADGRQWGDIKGAAKLSNTGATIGPLNLRYSSEADREGYVYLIGYDRREVYRYHTDTLEVALIDSGGYGTTIQGIAIKGTGAKRYLAIAGYTKVYGFPLGNNSGYFGPKDLLLDGDSTWNFWDVAWGRSFDDLFGDSTLFVTFYSTGDTALPGVAKFDLHGYDGTPLTMADTVWTARVNGGRANTLAVSRGIDMMGYEDIVYFTIARPAPTGSQGIYAVSGVNSPSPTIALIYPDKQDNMSQSRSDLAIDAAGNIIFFENSDEEVVIIAPPGGSNGFIIDCPDTIRVLESGTGVEGEPRLPEAFALLQNFPNPFNPSTKINYELPRVSHVTLKVYNTLGQEVATLINAVEEPGYKSVEWNAGGLASGVYFYCLTAGDFVATKKLLLVR